MTGSGDSSDHPPTSNWTLHFQGAESRVYFGTFKGKPAVKKERFVKTYRHPSLDEQLTRQRSRAEVRAINRLREKCPELSEILPEILFDDKRSIIMSQVPGAVSCCQAISEGVSKGESVDWIFREIGRLVGRIHSIGVIHGDLTTSNILVNEGKQLVPIDFGLSSSSTSAEDRAVDLYVLDRALQSTEVEEDKFNLCLETYATTLEKSDIVLKRLEDVRARGRKRDMTG